MSISPPRQPVELGYLALERLTKHVTEQERALASPNNDPRLTRIYQVTLMVSGYALNAIPYSDDYIMSAISELVTLLWGNASQLVIPEGPLSGRRTDPIAQMIEAARARLTVKNEDEIHVDQLAALADMTASGVRDNIRKSKTLVVSSEGRVTCESARAWLGKRGVAGYTQPVFKLPANVTTH